MLESLRNKRILLGISAGSEAYRAADIARALITAGTQVRAVLTDNAAGLVSPRSLEMITGGKVHIELYPQEGCYDPPQHSIAKWADAVLIAPANADIIARCALGMNSDLLSSIVLLSEKPVMFVPSMHFPVFENPAVKRNLEALTSCGYHIKANNYNPDLGDEGVGMGRTFNPADIVDWAGEVLYEAPPDMDGIKILVTAGPTIEEIDPVRYISNRSSGKMGFALAEEASKRGADVILIHGPVNIPTILNVEKIPVRSASEMLAAVQKEFPRCKAAVMAAAVADFKPIMKSTSKIKKGEGMILELTQNPDILAWMGANKKRQCLVGFALEDSENTTEARRKMETKNADIMVLNTSSAIDAECSQVVILGKEFEEKSPVQNKRKTARAILDYVAAHLKRQR